MKCSEIYCVLSQSDNQKTNKNRKIINYNMNYCHDVIVWLYQADHISFSRFCLWYKFHVIILLTLDSYQTLLIRNFTRNLEIGKKLCGCRPTFGNTVERSILNLIWFSTYGELNRKHGEVPKSKWGSAWNQKLSRILVITFG